MIVDHKIKIRKNQNFGKIALRNIFLRNADKTFINRRCR